MTVTIRKFTGKDSAILVKLLNKAQREAYEFTPYTKDYVLSRIREQDPKILMAEENDKVIGCVAYFDGHWGEEIEWLASSDEAKQKIIGDMLVSKIEQQVKGETVFTVIDAGSPKAEEWIERGYKQEGGLYHMKAKLDGRKPIPQIPGGTILRSLKPNEEEDFVEAVNAGFGWERLKQDTIERWKTQDPIFNEEWIHVAEHDGKIVSVVVVKQDTDYNSYFKAKRGYLGPAATLPEFRGKNLVSALTCRAMNFLFQKGMDSVALYTAEQNISSVTLLKKLGFSVGHHWKFMRKNLPKHVE